MLICDEVVKRYSSCVAVDHVNVRLEEGRVYAMLGPNGSGKTTLMKMIMGLIAPTEGTITIDGVPMTARDKANITYMPTENYFYSYMTIKDVVSFHKDFYKNFSEEHFYDLLNKMGLSFQDKVKNMSTGMLAKLKVAVALARHSSITMLDEPLNGIDILAREVIVRAIMDNVDGKRTFIISSHLVDELEQVVNGAMFMKSGKMVLAGDANELRRANGKSLVDLYKEVYGWGIPYAQQMSPMNGQAPMYGQEPMYGQSPMYGHVSMNGQPPMYEMPPMNEQPPMYEMPPMNGRTPMYAQSPMYGQPMYGQPTMYGQPGANEQYAASQVNYEMPAADKYSNPYGTSDNNEGGNGNV